MLIQRLTRSLVLVAAASLVAFPAVAANTTGGCPDGSVQWVYAQGSTGVGWMSNTPSNGYSTAMHQAEGLCDQAWSQVGVNPTYGMSINVSYGNGDPSWSYACIACIHSIVQNLNYAFEDLVIDTGSAGGIGGQVGGGVVIGINLKGMKSEEGPKYYVDVVRSDAIVQVEVDATTGKARVVGEEATADSTTKR